MHASRFGSRPIPANSRLGAIRQGVVSRRQALLAISLAALLAGCSTGGDASEGPADADDSAQGGGDSGGDGQGGGGQGGDGQGGGGGADTTGGGAKPFAPVCDDKKPCATGKMCVDGVCAPEPSANAKTTLSDPSKDHTEAAEPLDLSCVGADLATTLKGLPTDKTVTVWGRVDRFGGGGITSAVEVAIFRAADFHPEACAGIDDPADAQACFGDASKVGKPLATAVSVDPLGAKAAGLDVESAKQDDEECDLGMHLQCPSGFVCDKVSGFPKCVAGHGVYAIEGVPLNTPLIFRSRAVDPKNANGWHDSYTWNVVLLEVALDAKGKATQPSKYLNKETIRFNPTIVGEGQWQLVPTTIGIVGGIYEGDGVIGGRVRDCGTSKRRSWPVSEAQVGLGVAPEGLSYFNDSELDPVPAKSAVSTDIIGRYAAVGVPAGPNRVAATGRVAGKVVSLGSADVVVIPNALVIVSFPGLTPHNTK